MKKQAQIASTMVWMFAFILILAIIVIFISLSMGIAEKNLSSGENIKLSAESVFSRNSEKLLNFLDRKIVYNNSKIKIKELIYPGKEGYNEAVFQFKKLAKEFLDNEIAFSEESKKEAYIEVYYKDNSIFPGPKPLDYNLFRDPSNTKGGSSCAAGLDNSLILLIKNKKVIFCAE